MSIPKSHLPGKRLFTVKVPLLCLPPLMIMMVLSAATGDSSKSFTVTRKKLFGLIEFGPVCWPGRDEYDLPDYVGYICADLAYLPGLIRIKSAWPSPPVLEFLWRVLPGKQPLWLNFWLTCLSRLYWVGPGFTTKEVDMRKAGVDAVGQLGFTIFDNYLKMGQIFFEFQELQSVALLTATKWASVLDSISS